jgi:hypothetical protein
LKILLLEQEKKVLSGLSLLQQRVIFVIMFIRFVPFFFLVMLIALGKKDFVLEQKSDITKSWT